MADKTFEGSFLYIFEDGTIKLASTFTVEDQQSCKEGYLSVVDLVMKTECTFDEKEGVVWVGLDSVN